MSISRDKLKSVLTINTVLKKKTKCRSNGNFKLFDVIFGAAIVYHSYPTHLQARSQGLDPQDAAEIHGNESRFYRTYNCMHLQGNFRIKWENNEFFYLGLHDYHHYLKLGYINNTLFASNSHAITTYILYHVPNC
jgi:hypothetical protein